MRRPGKRYMVTSHAVEAPRTMVPAPTPSISHSVLPTYTHSTVETRCSQMPSEGPSAVRRTEPTGMATNVPIIAASSVQPSSGKPRRPAPARSAPSA